MAVLGLYPLKWRVGDQTLDIAGIGGVGTHPDWRGKGLMSELLTHIVAVMREQNYPLSWLGGQRQRYRYFGWERCGCQLLFDITHQNIRHEPAMQALPAVTLERVTDPDAAEFQDLQQWHDDRPMYFSRDGYGFGQNLLNWHSRPHLAHNDKGELVGYVVLDAEQRAVREVIGRDATAAQAIIRQVIEQADGQPVAVLRPAMVDEVTRWLHLTAEGMSVRQRQLADLRLAGRAWRFAERQGESGNAAEGHGGCGCGRRAAVAGVVRRWQRSSGDVGARRTESDARCVGAHACAAGAVVAIEDRGAAARSGAIGSMVPPACAHAAPGSRLMRFVT